MHRSFILHVIVYFIITINTIYCDNCLYVSVTILGGMLIISALAEQGVSPKVHKSAQPENNKGSDPQL